MSNILTKRRILLADRITELKGERRELLQIVKNTPLSLRRFRRAQDVPQRFRQRWEKYNQARKRVRNIRELMKKLNDEIGRIDSGKWKIKICIKNALAWLNSVRSPRELINGLAPDPLLRLHPRRRFRLSKTVATKILAKRNRLLRRRFTNLDQVASIEGVTDEILALIVRTGCGFSRPVPQPPPSTVSVLLPVRLETRFYEPDPQHANWRLRVRIIPDDIWYNEHDVLPTQEEIDSLHEFWQAVPDQDLNSENAHEAWNTLASRHSPTRAAWLVQKFPLEFDGQNWNLPEPSALSQGLKFNALHDLPPVIELWMGRAGNAPKRIKRLGVNMSHLKMDFPDPQDTNDHRWYEHWETAVLGGLATEIELGPDRPNDIDVLYVVGAGNKTPDALFRAHQDAGLMAALEPGMPTNTVAGEVAADLGHDSESWWNHVRGDDTLRPTEESISRSLTGKETTLGPIFGSKSNHQEIGQQLVRGLWPVIWGHALKDLLGLGGRVHEAGVWAGDNLFPEGPLPPIRIDDQPYALLPITSLNRWQAAKDDPKIETAMRETLLEIRSSIAQTVETKGNAENADTQRILDIIGATPRSDEFSYRVFISLELLFILYWSLDGGADGSELVKWWNEQNSALQQLGGIDVQRRYVSFGYDKDLGIPLVGPAQLPDDRSLADILTRLAGSFPGTIAAGGDKLLETLGGPLPDSLLVRLLMHAILIAAAEVKRQDERKGHIPLLEDVVRQDNVPSYLHRLVAKFHPNMIGSDEPVDILFNRLGDAIASIAKFPVDSIERVFKATLDTASHRIDPWFTGYAWRRLNKLTKKPTTRFRVGLYGWVDRPKPGKPGPTEAGLLHAPGQAQALTSAILRDQAIHNVRDQRWAMNISSDVVRIADELGAHIRAGVHPREALGHAVERLLDSKQDVQKLRQQFPIHESHEGHRVCDGQAILEANHTVLDPIIGAAANQQLDILRRAIDVYGDLLIAEGVHHATNGRLDTAGATMEAAAGLGSPPRLDVLNTPREARVAFTRVVFAMPFIKENQQIDHNTSPVMIADPSVAAYLESVLGAPGSDSWAWQVNLPDGSVTDLSLDDLGFTTAEALQIPCRQLHLLLQDMFPEEVTIDPAANGDATHARGQRFMRIFGSRPALLTDMGRDLIDEVAAEGEVETELALKTRYERLHQAAQALASELESARNQSDMEVRLRAARAAERWGFAPLLDAIETDEEVLSLRASTIYLDACLSGLQNRLTNAPDPADIASIKSAELARLLSELATAEGKLPVTGIVKLGNGELPKPFSPETTGADHSIADWLSINAQVREPMAYVELYQLDCMLEGNSDILNVLTDRPDDIWQQQVTPVNTDGSQSATALHVVFGPDDVLTPASPGAEHYIAVGLIDQWEEHIPLQEHTSSAAFGFNAPKARAQQAVLIAVPPAEDTAVDTQTLIHTLEETRELLRVRMLSSDEKTLYSGAAPTMMFPQSISLQPNESVN